MRRILLLSLIFVIATQGLVGQSFNLRTYSLDEGLPQSQVHAMVQDTNGYIWLGTDGGGLVKFDGKKFISFTDADGLANNLVLAMQMDPEGKLWLGTNKGISILSHEKFSAVPPVLNPLQHLSVRSLCIDGAKRIWFGTSQGAFVYNGSTLEPVAATKGQTILAAYSDPQHNMWLGTLHGGIYKVSKGQVSQYRVADGKNDNSAWAFLQTNSGALLVGTDNGLTFIRGDSVSRHPDAGPEGKKMLVRFLNYDQDGKLWIGTWNDGVYISHHGETSHIGATEGLELNGVLCFLQDREKNIWIGTDGGGVVKFGSQAITSISARNGLPSNMVLSMCRGKSGRIWFGHDNGLSLYEDSAYQFFDAGNGLASEKVWCVYEEHPGLTWIATYGSGLYQYQNGKFRPFPANNSLSSKNVRTIKKDSRGRLWVGTAMGLNLISGDGITVFTVNEGLPANRILGVFEDSKGRLWLGTSGGGIVQVVEQEGGLSFKTYSENNGLADNVVLSIAEDRYGNIWTANFGGVSCLDPASGKIRTLTTKDGLCSNTAYAIAFTNDGSAIIGTNNGIDKLDAAGYIENGKVSIRHFGKGEGFRGVECNTNSIVKDEAGRIWIGTIKGAFIYDPALDKLNETEPQTHITSLRLFFEKPDYAAYAAKDSAYTFVPDGMTFPHGQNHITFDFIGISFSIPENVRYSYLLEGFDKSWTSPSSVNFATYTNLPPGRYVFKVRSCNNDGKWNAQPATLAFTVTPPFWKTWWFRFTAIMILILSVYGIFKSRIKRLRRTQELLEKQVQLKTKELREEKETVEQQHKLIEKKNHDITSSIRYAKRIQESILPVKEKLNELWPESFIFYKPKDIVSGDFYWFTEHNGQKMVATVDCTGHGVPGAFMSLVGNNLLNEIVRDKRLKDPARILEKLHEGVVTALKKSDHESDTVDGMDITLCVIDEEKKKLEIAATGRPVLLVRRGEVKRIKIGKHPLGLVTKKELKFEKETIDLKPGDTFYLYTDGYCDQFGSQDDEKYMDGRFEKLLQRMQSLAMSDQANQLETEINNWRGEHPQIDDMLVVGIRIS